MQMLPWSERLCGYMLLHVLCLDPGGPLSVVYAKNRFKRFKGNKCAEAADDQSLLLDCKLIHNDSVRPCAGEQ